MLMYILERCEKGVRRSEVEGKTLVSSSVGLIPYRPFTLK